METWLIEELDLRQTNFSETDVLGAYNTLGKQQANWLWDDQDTAIAAGGLYTTAEDLLGFALYHNNQTLDYLSASHQRLAQGPKAYDVAFGWKKLRDQPII